MIFVKSHRILLNLPLKFGLSHRFSPYAAKGLLSYCGSFELWVINFYRNKTKFQFCIFYS